MPRRGPENPFANWMLFRAWLPLRDMRTAPAAVHLPLLSGPAALADKFEAARHLTRGQQLLALNREWALKEHDRPSSAAPQVTMRLAWARSASDEPVK